MPSEAWSIGRRLALAVLILGGLLGLAFLFGISLGSSPITFGEVLDILTGQSSADPTTDAIVRQIRLPRVVLAAVAGATLALGGVVFQALLRNPLAEPYILGVSGGSAVGAIGGMLAGLAPFPGVAVMAFGGSLLVLLLLVTISGRGLLAGREALLLGGVMLNAFCGAVIMFLVSLSSREEVHHILFWLMGDLSMFNSAQFPMLLGVLPSFLLILALARPMNLLLLGRDNAAALGVNVQLVNALLLGATTLMVSLVVCQTGLIGFVGLVIPHILRLLLGSDHRLLAPASLLGGAAYLIFCDLLARSLPAQGEMPVGIVTALVGAPLFIFLLWRARR
ncbi:MAG TPA: iron ABC transporter permease [Desulfurivibrionaceae bacterium]|nr:iron ABC transporter permease [Desulfurivibrionaceae bacterium]